MNRRVTCQSERAEAVGVHMVWHALAPWVAPDVNSANAARPKLLPAMILRPAEREAAARVRPG